MVPLSTFTPAVAELSALELLFSGVTAGTAVYVQRNRHTPVERYLLLMLIGATGYMFASGAHVFVGRPTVAHIVHNGTYAFGTVLTAAGTLMIITFTDRKGLQRRWFVWLLCGFVFIDILAAVTDPWFGLIIRELTFVEGGAIVRTAEHTGAYFWVRNIVLYILAALSLLLLLVELSDADGIYRRQLSLVAAGQTFVIAMFLVQILVPNVPGFDFASVGLFGGTLIIVVAVRRWQFGQVLPVAHKTLVDSMDDAVIVLGPDNRVVSINPQGSELFGLQRSSIGEPLGECLPAEEANAAPFTDGGSGEISFEKDQTRQVYSYQVSPAASQGMQIGRVITFRDITEQREREMLLRETTNQAQSERDGKELVTELLLASSSRHVVAETACQLLVETYEYEAAWVIWVEPEVEPIVASARGDVDQLETDVAEPLAVRVIESGESETVESDENGEFAGVLRDRQVASVEATPITYERLITGVLCVVSTDAPLETTAQITRQIATALGFKRSVDDQRIALFADIVEEVTIRIDTDHFLGTVTAGRAIPVEVVETYHTAGDVMYIIRSESDLGSLKSSLREHEHVANVTAVSTDPVLLAVHVQAMTVSSVLADFGGVTRLIRGEAGSVTITVEFAPQTDIRAALDAVSDSWPTARLTKRQQQATVPDAFSPSDSLTQRQEDALQAAALLGFFSRPQRARAEDVAEALGVSQSTALQHIRRAEEKIFENMFSDESQPLARTEASGRVNED